MKKNRRRAPALALMLALVLSMCACGGRGEDPAPAEEAAPAVTEAPAPTPPPDPGAALTREQQIALLEQGRDRWAFTDPYDSPWFYTYTDLDHNGRYEVLAATTQGSGIFTYANFYEVTPEGTGIRNLYHEGVTVEGVDDWPEIVMESLPGYQDPDAGRWVYACEGITRDGAARQYFAWYVLELKDGAAEWERIAQKTVEWTEGRDEPTVTCTDAAGNPISQADYEGAPARRYAAWEAFTLPLEWKRVEIPQELAGTAATPAPAAGTAGDQAQNPAGEPIVITKNPTSEALSIGGRTWFIAYAQNIRSTTWEFLSPEGAAFSLEQTMKAHPGLQLELPSEDTLAVSNVPASLNGWAVRVRFMGSGSSALTEPAYIYVGDFVNAYAEPIRAYKETYETGNQGNPAYLRERGLSEMAGYFESVGYALKDLDKDGTPELILAGITPTEGFTDSQGLVYGVYTLDGAGQPVSLAVSQARDRFFLRADSSLLRRGSGGAAYTYYSLLRLRDGALQVDEMAFTDLDGDNHPLFYTQQGDSDTYPGDKSVPVSEDAFWDIVSRWEGSAYTPPLTRLYG